MNTVDSAGARALREENARLAEENATLKRELAAVRTQLATVAGRRGAVAAIVAPDTAPGPEVARLQDELDVLKQEIERKRGELIVVEDEVLLESFGLYRPKFALTRSADYLDRLEKIRDFQKALIRDGEAVRIGGQSPVAAGPTTGRRGSGSMAKYLLRAFNNECDYCVENARFNNIAASEKRIEQSFATLNKLGKIVNLEIAERYKGLKLDELHIAYEYQCRRREERDALRAARELEREQEKVEKEIREAREKVERDRGHLAVERTRLEGKLTANPAPEERIDIEEKLAQIQSRLSELAEVEKRADWREANPKAGHVYVVSNIGAFGEGVYKIGVTRREHPDVRISELGDASVPFKFDIHATIPAVDAYDLEAKIHAHFQHCRVNKVNAWKEFFRVDLREIEAVIREHFDNTFDLVHEAAAEEYRESLRL